MKINKNWLAVGAGVLVIAVVGVAVGLNQGALFSGSLSNIPANSESHEATPPPASFLPAVSCVGTPNPAETGTVDNVTWTAKVANITDSVTYAWHGSGITGTVYANPIMAHYPAGLTSATVFVSATYGAAVDPSLNPGHTVTASCTIALQDQINKVVSPSYTQPTIALTPSCMAQNATPTVGDSVTFVGHAVGGSAPYSIKWSGKGIDGQTNEAAVTTYTDADVGNQTATLTITDAANTTKTAQCSVQVMAKAVPLSATCQASTTNPVVGDSVIWTAQPAGGKAPYTYQWSGANLPSQTSQSTNSIKYTAAGSQSAVATVTDSNNVSANAQCSLTVTDKTVTQPVVPPTSPAKTPTKTTTTTVDNCAGFPDLAAQDPNCDAVTFVQESGAMTGNANGSFDAEGLIQRDQIAKIALETFGLYNDQDAYCQGGVSGFPDVSLNDWSFQYVCRAKSLGVITGYLSGPDAGFFRPSRFVSRAEFLAIILRNLKEAFPKGTSYADVSLEDWYSTYARFAYNNNLYPGNSLFPEKDVTRREAAVVLFKLHQLGKI